VLYLFGPTHGTRSQQHAFGNFLKERRVNYRHIYEYENLIDLKIKEGDTFLCGIPVDCYERNIETIKFLKSTNARVFFLLDHWHNSYKNFYDLDTNQLILPDKIFCIDNFMKKNLQSGGIKSENIIVSGHPDLENTFNKKITYQECENTKLIHNIRGDLFTLYLDPVPQSRKIEIGYCDTEVVDLVCRAFYNFKKEHTLLIKCHPRTEINDIEDTVSRFGKDKILISNNLKNISNNQILNISEKIVGMTTIMLAHALVLEKPTKSIQINPTELGKKRSNYLLDKIKIQSLEEVCEHFQSKNFKKSIVDTCIFRESCSKIYYAMDI
tara:strand:+ start:24953 stop:25927 length:975 start_codon:yes stop_codon:yes gene_type:complete